MYDLCRIYQLEASAALHAEGKRLKGEAGKKSAPGRKAEKDPTESVETFFDTQKEQLKLAGIKNVDYLTKVKYVEENKQHWNEIVETNKVRLIQSELPSTHEQNSSSSLGS